MQEEKKNDDEMSRHAYDLNPLLEQNTEADRNNLFLALESSFEWVFQLLVLATFESKPGGESASKPKKNGENNRGKYKRKNGLIATVVLLPKPKPASNKTKSQ